MKKIRKPGGLIVIILFSFTAGILFTALGAYAGNRLNLPDESPVIFILACIMLAMIAFILAMLVAGLVARRKANRVNSAAEMRDAINKEKDSVRADHTAARKNLRSAKRRRFRSTSCSPCRRRKHRRSTGVRPNRIRRSITISCRPRGGCPGRATRFSMKTKRTSCF